MTDTPTTLQVKDGGTPPAVRQIGMVSDATGLLYSVSVQRVNGGQVSSANPYPTADAAAEAALTALVTASATAATAAGQAASLAQETATAAALGTPADTAWSGAGSGSVVAVCKAIWAKLAGTLTIGGTVAVSGTVAVQDAAAESALTTIATDQATSVTALASIATNTAPGAAGSGLSQPSGGSGVLGFLSGIYARLGGSLAVTGTFYQATQPVSGTVGLSGSLPDTAGGSLASIATNTAPGAAGSGLSQPSGGSGVLGFLSGIYARLVGTLLVSDAQSMAFQGAVSIAPGTSLAAGRSIGFIMTAAGTVTLTLANGSTITLPLAVSPYLQTLPFAVTNIALGTGAAGTFWNLL